MAKEDLLEIKRPKSSPLFFLEEESEPVNKNPWDLAVESIKGKDTYYRVSQQVLNENYTENLCKFGKLEF